jgi:hypothetical protein
MKPAKIRSMASEANSTAVKLASALSSRSCLKSLSWP